MRAARSESDAPSVRTADASDIGPQLPARYGQNDREIALNRKNALFAGSDGGGEQWAVIASLIETCKLCEVEPQNYLAEVITRIVNGHPNGRIDELLPWAYIAAPALKDVA
jgi:transposase